MPTLVQSFNAGALFTMLKGEPGTRKSTQALSYPQPQYWISTDQKMESLVLPATKWGYDITSRDMLEYDDYNNYTKIENKLMTFQERCRFKTIIVDSITSLGDVMNMEINDAKKDEKGTEKVFRIGNIQVDTLDNYKGESSGFRKMISLLKDIHKFHKIHVILIAHVIGQRKDDSDNKLTHHSRVIVTGGDKISAKVSSYMTEVYHFNVKPGATESSIGNFSCITVHTGNDYARTSLDLPREIVFDDRPLYGTWIKPAFEKLQLQTNQTNQTNKPNPTNLQAVQSLSKQFTEPKG